MRLLLDTHVALWFVLGDERLSMLARELIAEPANQVFVSIVSLLEIAIKNSLGRAGPQAIGIRMSEANALFSEGGFAALELTTEHIATLETLPRHHGDPFDRLLVAQATIEQFRLMTADEKLAPYGDFVVPA